MKNKNNYWHRSFAWIPKFLVHDDRIVIYWFSFIEKKWDINKQRYVYRTPTWRCSHDEKFDRRLEFACENPKISYVLYDEPYYLENNIQCEAKIKVRVNDAIEYVLKTSKRNPLEKKNNQKLLHHFLLCHYGRIMFRDRDTGIAKSYAKLEKNPNLLIKENE